MNPYRELANGIVNRALDDYAKALRKAQKQHYPNRILEIEIEELEHFFLSDWFKMLVDVDGAEIIRTYRAVILK